MDTIGSRIRIARKNAQLTQYELSKLTHLSRSYIGDIEKDRYNPSVSTLKLIAKATNCPLSDLLTSAEPSSEKKPQGVKIPVVGKVVAGIPLEAIQESDIVDYEEIPLSMASTGTFFALRVSGSSMEPTLRDGDTVIVKQQPDVDSGNIAIVLVNGNDATIKEVQKSREGITLVGHNVAAYSPHFYSNAEIENLPVRIIGRVVESRRKF